LFFVALDIRGMVGSNPKSRLREEYGVAKTKTSIYRCDGAKHVERKQDR
jgi:hypothetical protein